MFDNARKILYNSKANPIISIGGVRKWQYPREKHLRPESVNWKLSKPNLVECPHCHELKKPHQVCGNCGYYDNEEVVSKVEKKAD